MEENRQYDEMKENAAFVAEGPMTREMFLDLQKAWTGRRISFLCIFILFACIFIWNLLTMYLDFVVTVMAFAVIVIYALVLFLAPRANAKRQYETMLIANGGETRLIHCFAENGIEQYNTKTGAHMHYDYLRIRKMQKTKLCYLLWLEKNVVYVVAHNTLTKGTEAELEAFLISKCYLAKRKF